MNGKTNLASFLLAALLVIPGIPWIGDTEGDLIDEGSLEPHDPIVIDGDDDLTAANGVRGGSGTEADPYVISNWSISFDDSNGIVLVNTSKQVMISNCDLVGSWKENVEGAFESIGIMVQANNITIEDCRIQDAMTGIQAVGSYLSIFDVLNDGGNNGFDIQGSHSVISGCRFDAVISNSIELSQGDDVEVSNCTVDGGKIGIYYHSLRGSVIKDNYLRNCHESIDLLSSDNNVISNNYLEMSEFGLFIWGNNNTIENNIIDSMYGEGIEINFNGNKVRGNTVTNSNIGLMTAYYTTSADITDNLFFFNSEGINIRSFVDGSNTITNNNISSSIGYGLNISGMIDPRHGRSTYIVSENVFYKNNKGGVQANDKEGFSQFNGTSGIGNFWSDYESRYVPPATRNGSFWTVPYSIDGGKGSIDMFPLVTNEVGSKSLLKLSKNNIEQAFCGVKYAVYYSVAYVGEGTVFWSFDTDATWLTFRAHVLTGTPTDEDIGSYWINISASDGILTDSTNFTLKVSLKNLHPVITTEDVGEAYQWQMYSVDYEAMDYDKSLVWELTTNATFLSINSSTGVLSGTPGLNDVGPFMVNVSVNDGELYGIHHFNLTVMDMNDPPMMVGTYKELAMDEDSALTLAISEVFFNYDGDPITLTVTASERISAIVIDGTIKVESDANYHGPGHLNYTVSDGHYVVEYSSAIEVRSVNDRPSDLEMALEEARLVEGDYQIIQANFSDADMDDMNATWFIDGSIVGYGPLLNLSLSEGTYNLTLRVTDENGAYTELTRTLVIEGKVVPAGHGPPYLLFAIVGMLVIMMVIGSLIFILRKRSRGDGTPEARSEDFETHTPTLPEKDLPLAPAPSIGPSVKLGPLGPVVEPPSMGGEGFDIDLTSPEREITHLRRKLNIMQDDGKLTEEELDRIVAILERIEE